MGVAWENAERTIAAEGGVNWITIMDWLEVRVYQSTARAGRPAGRAKRSWNGPDLNGQGRAW
jgi:hypothetical protein